MKFMHCILLTALISCSAGKSEEELLSDFEIANQVLKSEDYPQAIILYNALIIASPKFAAAINNRGIAYMEQGYQQKALADYERALELEPDFYDAAFNRTNALWALGRWRPALEDLKELATHYDSSALHFRMGQIYHEQDQLPFALEAFDQALILDSLNAGTWINRGNIQYYLGDLAKAKRDIQQGLNLEPSNPIALNSKALLAIESRELSQALVWVNMALEVKPDDPYFLNNKGQVYLEMDSLALAEQFINQSMLLDPENPWAFRNKAIWYLKKQSPSKALNLLQQLQVLTPTITVKDYYFYLGEAHLATGNLEEACTSWYQGKAKKEKKSDLKWRQSCQTID